jgi:drug/metabolite transporter (DMT)-like permease
MDEAGGAMVAVAQCDQRIPGRGSGMAIGLVCALTAALASGVAVVLQGLAARRQPSEQDLDVFLLWRLVRSPAYLAGLALTALGFLLALVALQQLPLFVVQAVRASSLAVTALVAVPVLGTRLLRYEVVGVIVVAGGLTMLGLSATASPAPTVGLAWRLSLFAVVAILALAAAVVARSSSAASGYLLGVIAGLLFATLNVCARVLSDPTDLIALVADPAAWALALSGALALLVFATAAQRAPVTGLTATMVATETLASSAVGVALLGDGSAPGRWWLAAIGFVLTLGGALSIARAGTRAQSPAPVRELQR